MIILTVLGYVSNFANFEITVIDNSSRYLGGGGCNDLKVRTLRGGVAGKLKKRVQGEKGGPKIDEVERA